MSNIDLWLAVAKAQNFKNVRIDGCGDAVIYDHEYKEYPETAPRYTESFDAIMPLVREVSDISYALLDIYYQYKYDWLEAGQQGSDFREFADWLVYEAKPADYCRAYLAAKGGK